MQLFELRGSLQYILNLFFINFTFPNASMEHLLRKYRVIKCSGVIIFSAKAVYSLLSGASAPYPSLKIMKLPIAFVFFFWRDEGAAHCIRFSRFFNLFYFLFGRHTAPYGSFQLLYRILITMHQKLRLKILRAMALSLVFVAFEFQQLFYRPSIENSMKTRAK